MAQRAIREFQAKQLLKKYWTEYFGNEIHYQTNSLLVGPETNLDDLAAEHGWLVKQDLVVKPDQLFGKRGKHNLILVNTDFKGQAIGSRNDEILKSPSTKLQTNSRTF